MYVNTGSIGQFKLWIWPLLWPLKVNGSRSNLSAVFGTSRILARHFVPLNSKGLNRTSLKKSCTQLWLTANKTPLACNSEILSSFPAPVMVIMITWLPFPGSLSGFLGVLQEFIQTEGIFLHLAFKLDGSVTTSATISTAEIFVGNKSRQTETQSIIWKPVNLGIEFSLKFNVLNISALVNGSMLNHYIFTGSLGSTCTQRRQPQRSKGFFIHNINLYLHRYPFIPLGEEKQLQ